MYKAAIDTKYGNKYHIPFMMTGYQEADFLFDHRNDYWPIITKEIDFWTINDRPTTGDAKKYFDTLEHNLNTAIYYSAAAINYLINQYVSCECEGEKEAELEMGKNAEKEGIAEPISNEQKIKLKVTQLFGTFGIAAALVALALEIK